jgi:membrane-bound serine protease (ClpP class)
MIPSGLRSWAFLLLFVALQAASAAGRAQAEAGRLAVIRIDDYIINPVIAEYVHQAIGRAEKEGYACLVIELDTPGGLLNSTRNVVKDIVNARIPVVVYISPNGARAGSAGVFITLASHVAAMAPSTHIGAAHPVPVGGDSRQRSMQDVLYEFLRYLREKDRGGEGERTRHGPETSPEEPFSEKIMQDTLAWARAMAEERGRNVAWAEKAVRESASQTEREALALKIVELIAQDRRELLTLIDGREVKLASGATVTLRTKDAAVSVIPLTARQRFLNTIIHPNIAYILMLLGFYGLLFEVTHPGFGVPGIVGVISLILAFYAFQALPVNYAGLALILLGIVLLIAEIKVTSFGLLALGGIVCLLLGSLMLFESPHSFLRVSVSVVLPFVLAAAGLTLFLGGAVLRAHRRKVSTGAEGLIGEIGTAEGPDQIFVHGEVWQAMSSVPLQKGDRVEVTGVDRLILRVRKVERSSRP